MFMMKAKQTKYSPFSSAAEEKAWRHKTMLTVQKLIDWLKTQDPDALIYSMESNTGDYQEIPPDLPNHYLTTVAQAKKQYKQHLKQWYSKSKNAKKKIITEFNDVFKYTEDNGIILN